MSTPPTTMAGIERAVRAAGAAGIRTKDIAAACGMQMQSISRPMWRLMEQGRLARLQVSFRNVVYFAPEFAPEGAEHTPPTGDPNRVKPPQKRVDECVAMRETLDLVTRAGSIGATIPWICSVRGCANATAYKALQKLIDRKLVANVRHSHKESRYYLPDLAPKIAPRRVAATPQRTTTIRDANVVMPLQGEPIITSDTKVTICPSGRDQRFTFSPPPGWRGQITSDWLDRRLAA